MPFPLPAALAFAVAVGSPAPPLHTEIERLIAAGHSNYAHTAVPLATDAEFLRRVTLDLTGIIPTAAEARAFLSDGDPRKRENLIDRLLGSYGYSRRLAQHFDVVFMERRPDAKVPHAAWEEYLRSAFAANKPYDQLAREILAADGTDPASRAPAKFFLDRKLEPNVVAKDVGRVFLGRNLQCAQCHDHPNVEAYKQDEYYGLLAFLNRTYLFPNADAATAVIAEKADGEVSFVSVFDPKKAQKGTPPKVRGLDPIADPTLPKGKEYKVAPAKDVRPVPVYSRRAQLAAAVTHPKNRAFARTAANRLWALMLGRGLVHPLDLDHPDNPPSHPELLDLLTDRFAASNYNVKWFLREIALSGTYQRASTGPTDAPPDRFLVAALKPLSPEQFAYALLQATGYAEAERASLGKNATDAALDAKLAPQVAPFRRKFGASEGQSEDGFLATLDQTLFLKHGGPLRGFTTVRAGNTADRVAKLTDAAAAADELFLSVFTRLPTAEERAEVAEFLKAAGPRPAAAAEAVWALVASAEFRFNH
jgi:hypothetical protein